MRELTEGLEKIRKIAHRKCNRPVWLLTLLFSTLIFLSINFYLKPFMAPYTSRRFLNYLSIETGVSIEPKELSPTIIEMYAVGYLYKEWNTRTDLITVILNFRQDKIDINMPTLLLTTISMFLWCLSCINTLRSYDFNKNRVREIDRHVHKLLLYADILMLQRQDKEGKYYVH